MALTTTTLSAAVGVNDTTILLASVTGLAVGSILEIDGEIMKVASPVSTATTVPQSVLRGQDGTYNQAHASGAQVKLGSGQTALVASDFPQPMPGSGPAAIPAAPGRERLSYSAAGAITLPRVGCDMYAELNGTSVLAMTLANPSAAASGSLLIIAGNGKAAHTVTYSAGLGNVGATADVITFKADQAQAIVLVSVGGFWVQVGMVAGAATIAGPGIA